MKRKLLIGLILTVALTAISAVSYGTAVRRATKTHQFRCTDKNQSLYFLVYEVDGKLDRGLMYVENMQVANMTVEWAGTNFVKATVNGNAANVSFLLGKDGNLMVANYATHSRVPVCHSSYAYK